MQAVESNVVSLRSVDGGLARLELDVLAGQSAIADPDLEPVLDGVARTLEAIVPGARLGTPEPKGDGFGAWLRVPQPQQAPMHVRRVRAFAPAVRARDRNVDVVIVSSPRVAGAAATGAPLDAAFRLAARLGCEQLAVVSDATSDGIYRPTPVDGIEYLDIATCLHALAAGEPVADMLVVPETYIEAVAAVASGVTGAAALGTAHDFSATGLRSTAGAVSTDALPTLPGMLLAMAELLVLSGRRERGRLIADALCRTLEDGVHTPDIDVTHPYARLVDDAAFAEAVIERLGEPVRSVQAHFARLPGCGAASRRPAMHVIRGGAQAS